LLAALQAWGVAGAALIGQVTGPGDGQITVEP
jgi:hypothetical protein